MNGEHIVPCAESLRRERRLRVNRAIVTMRRPLPVYPDQRPPPGTATALSELPGGCRETVTKGPDRVYEERTHHGDLHREASSRSLPQAWPELRAHCDSP